MTAPNKSLNFEFQKNFSHILDHSKKVAANTLTPKTTWLGYLCKPITFFLPVLEIFQIINSREELRTCYSHASDIDFQYGQIRIFNLSRLGKLKTVQKIRSILHDTENLLKMQREEGLIVLGIKTLMCAGIGGAVFNRSPAAIAIAATAIAINILYPMIHITTGEQTTEHEHVSAYFVRNKVNTKERVARDIELVANSLYNVDSLSYLLGSF